MGHVRFFDRPAPLVFAHRGGCALGPENTLVAFDRGLAAGADGLELDVHLSADGVVVVHHDAMLERTTNGTGPVAGRTAAELMRLDATCRFAAAADTVPLAGETSHGQPSGDPSLTAVPALRAVLSRYPGVPIIVEMKVDSAAMGLAVARDVQAADAVDRVCAAGYGRRCLDAVRTALPELVTSASRAEVQLAFYRSCLRWPVRRVAYGGYQVPEYAGRLRIVDPRFIRHAHGAGLRVQVWTVDDRADMERLLDWGADALITNRPDLAVQVREARQRRRRRHAQFSQRLERASTPVIRINSS